MGLPLTEELAPPVRRFLSNYFDLFGEKLKLAVSLGRCCWFCTRCCCCPCRCCCCCSCVCDRVGSGVLWLVDAVQLGGDDEQQLRHCDYAGRLSVHDGRRVLVSGRAQVRGRHDRQDSVLRRQRILELSVSRLRLYVVLSHATQLPPTKIVSYLNTNTNKIYIAPGILKRIRAQTHGVTRR